VTTDPFGGNGPDPKDFDPAHPPEQQAPPGDAEADLELSIRGARAREGSESGEMTVDLNTTRGVIEMHFRPCEGKTGAAIFIGGAGGGVDGPADRVYVRLGDSLSERGISTLRVSYREAGEFQECVLDTLAACSFLKGLGASKVVVVGHSFGGAVAIKAAELSPLVGAVVAMSSQRFGTHDVEKLDRPLLLIHGSKDDVLDKAASEDIHSRAKDPKQLVILEGAGHGLAEAADDVFNILQDFIGRQVGVSEDS
jgi:hypothetical protein